MSCAVGRRHDSDLMLFGYNHSCSSDSIPRLGTAVCCRWGSKKGKWEDSSVLIPHHLIPSATHTWLSVSLVFSSWCFELLSWSHKVSDFSGVTVAVNILSSICGDLANYLACKICSKWEALADPFSSSRESQSLILLATPASIIYFRLFRSWVMAVAAELQSSSELWSHSESSSLLLTSLFKIFLSLIKILVAVIKWHPVLTLSYGTSEKTALDYFVIPSAGGTDVLHSGDLRGNGFHCNCWPALQAQLGWHFHFCLFCGFHYPGGQGTNVSGIAICGRLVKFWNRARTIQCLGWISWSLSKYMGCPLVPRGQTWL